jgi:hypothetical protein
VTSFIPHLAQIARSGRGRPGIAPRRRAPERSPPRPVRLNVEYLAGLVPTVRRRVGIPPGFSDAAIFAALAAIAARASDEQRWRAAEASTLALFLLAHGRDLRAAIVTILGLLPKPYH